MLRAQDGEKSGGTLSRQGGGHLKGAFRMSMQPEHHHHDEAPVREPENGGGLVGYAAIKYVAIVAIVIAILVFLALYLIPALT